VWLVGNNFPIWNNKQKEVAKYNIIARRSKSLQEKVNPCKKKQTIATSSKNK
jgi:hypothetical protein